MTQSFRQFFVHIKGIELQSAVINCDGEDDQVATVELDQRFIYDTYGVTMPEANAEFTAGKTYRIIFKYKAKILDDITGVYCAMDSDTKHKLKPKLDELGYKSIKDLQLIQDEELRDQIIDHTVFCTNLEPAEARTFLPCIDEPLFKARFKLTINLTEKQVINQHTAISNTPVESRSEDGKKITFE